MSNKKLTPEETLLFYCKNTFEKAGNMSQICMINAVENYAAQEVAEKDAQLKEAIDKGQKLYNSLMSIHLHFGNESHAFQMSNELYNWCDFINMNNFNSGKEAAKDGKSL